MESRAVRLREGRVHRRRDLGKPGRFELADGGTLFLDEIGEIPVEMQVKLLRAIQESEFERVGGLKTIKVDVRLITATNRDLEAGDPARQRSARTCTTGSTSCRSRSRRCASARGDIPLLVQHIIKKFNERLKKTITGIADDALAALEAHALARQHPRARERARAHDPVLRRATGSSAPTSSSAPPPDKEPAAARTTTNDSQPLPILDAEGDDLDDGAETSGSLKDAVRAETARVERELIVKALDETGGNVTQAASLLKISRKSLQMKMKEFGLRDREVSRRVIGCGHVAPRTLVIGPPAVR